MKNWKKLLSLCLALVMMLGLLSACGSEPSDTSAPPADATDAPPAETGGEAEGGDDVYAMEGAVTIAYPEGETAEIQPVLEAFRVQYPNIEVIEEPFPGSTGGAFNEYLAQKAASGSMPDLMWLDWNDFAPEVASGYVYDISEMFFSDPESEYVPSGKLSDTFWMSHEMNPVNVNYGYDEYANADEFGILSKQGNMFVPEPTLHAYTVYQEGMYLGYRYTETRYEDAVMGAENVGDYDYSEVVAFPFGYGLSYTTFEYSNFQVTKTDERTYQVSLDVTNTGDTYSGKESVQIYVSDGLSSASVAANIPDLLPAILQGLQNYKIDVGTPFFVKYGRVGVMDEISEVTGADVTCTLIGERPGLITAESMSAYIAYKATVGMPEARRTVVSNIHKAGTIPAEAGAHIADIIKIMLEKKASGTDLKL